jgi:hypothetical protein
MYPLSTTGPTRLAPFPTPLLPSLGKSPKGHASHPYLLPSVTNLLTSLGKSTKGHASHPSFLTYLLPYFPARRPYLLPREKGVLTSVTNLLTYFPGEEYLGACFASVLTYFPGEEYQGTCFASVLTYLLTYLLPREKGRPNFLPQGDLWTPKGPSLPARRPYPRGVLTNSLTY